VTGRTESPSQSKGRRERERPYGKNTPVHFIHLQAHRGRKRKALRGRRGRTTTKEGVPSWGVGTISTLYQMRSMQGRKKKVFVDNAVMLSSVRPRLALERNIKRHVKKRGGKNNKKCHTQKPEGPEGRWGKKNKT